MKSGLTRRETIGLAGIAGAGYLVAGPGGAVSSLDHSETTLAEAARRCLKLTPEAEEGPFYVNVNMIRRDIRESTAGVPLLLKIRVLNVKTCRPVENAALDIWQANARGEYSAEQSQGTSGETYLRGIQVTDAKGMLTFRTVYPGHYEGRATHIHAKVHIGETVSGQGIEGGHVAHTGQVFFDDALGNRVYETSAYAEDTAARVLNSADRVYTRQGGARSRLKLTGSLSKGLTGSITLGVNPRSTPAAVM